MFPNHVGADRHGVLNAIDDYVNARHAAITALRDAAASIVVGFTKAPGVEEYILTRIDRPDEAVPEVALLEDGVPEDPLAEDPLAEDPLAEDPLSEDNLLKNHETAEDQS